MTEDPRTLLAQVTESVDLLRGLHVPEAMAQQVINQLATLENRVWRTRREVEAAYQRAPLVESILSLSESQGSEFTQTLSDLYERRVVTVDWYRLSQTLRKAGVDLPVQEGTTT